MKKPVSIFLFLILSYLCKAQTNEVESSRYGLKGDVVKVRTTLFYSGSKKIQRVTDMIFKDGYIEFLSENYPETNIKNSYRYQYQKNKKEFTLHFQRYDHQHKKIDSTSNFQRVQFQSLKFYYPKYQLSTQTRTYPTALDVLYTLSGERYFTLLKLQKDSIVTERNNFHDFRTQDFNQKGQLISQKFSNKYMNKYYYNTQGQLTSDDLYQNLMKRSQNRPIKTVYVYENDARGNWIKRLSIVLEYRNKINENSIITFETRELIYQDGFSSGSSEYDDQFIQKKILIYK